ncbi:MAG: ABC transporter ATP-binding protein [Acidobacteria bacterium]|nr:ABC transporter ATP-binding protein [Acidobacteriota bacterium]
MNSESRVAASPLKVAGPAVRVRGLCKEFSSFASPWDRLVEWGTLGRYRRHETVPALQDVSFDLRRGGALALVGANGAGKSTLLKIVSGTLFPTAGQVEVGGRVASLLELGMGFQPEFSGRENVVFNGRFLGLKDHEIRDRMTDIIAFAELEHAIQRPLRTYSSGMLLRLAFAVVAHVDPDILVIDEALAVGDAYFTQKCLARIRRFRRDGVTLLFASHDPLAVKSICDEALLLVDGRRLDWGPPESVLEHYNSLVARGRSSRAILDLEGASSEASRRPESEGKPRRSGNSRALVAGFSLTEAGGSDCRSFMAGDEAMVRVRALFLDHVEEPTVGLLIRDRLGNDVYGTNTWQQQISTGSCRPGDLLEVGFRIPLDLGPGEYSLTVALHTLESHVHDSFDWIDRLLVFRVLSPPEARFIGTAFLRPTLDVAAPVPLQDSQAWTGVLTAAFGGEPPRVYQVGESTPPWLFQGWYQAERGHEDWFAWTRPSFGFIIDLRGQFLELEVGARPDARRDEAVEAEISMGSVSLGGFAVTGGGGWTCLRIPIPPEVAGGAGLVRVTVPGWRASAAGEGGDPRLLGLRVRRIHVT